MKTIYATQDEAVNAIITQFGTGYRYMPVDGGFAVVPEQPTDEFLTGEQIPSEVRKKPTELSTRHQFKPCQRFHLLNCLMKITRQIGWLTA